MKSIENEIAESINKSKIIVDEIISSKIEKFNDNYMVIVRTNKKDIAIEGLTTRKQCELTKVFIETLMKLSKTKDRPEGFFEVEIEVSQDFIEMLLSNVALNMLANEI